MTPLDDLDPPSFQFGRGRRGKAPEEPLEEQFDPDEEPPPVRDEGRDLPEPVVTKGAEGEPEEPRSRFRFPIQL
jgi:hypothetical protein